MTSFLPLIICSSLYLFAMMVMIEIITTNRFGSIRYFLVGGNSMERGTSYSPRATKSLYKYDFVFWWPYGYRVLLGLSSGKYCSLLIYKFIT